ncbi:hypothetical protein AMTR_s00007p00262110 [Amborella trichopoda]|uniref:Uncharacterized protein n=1 Tax=Amborella trichopoda TaxID=13333 RepID=W1P6L1_AMBTC|nr:hypothetical protein AMTR_s00007p00262110 [Amborella trichopoda]
MSLLVLSGKVFELVKLFSFAVMADEVVVAPTGSQGAASLSLPPTTSELMAATEIVAKTLVEIKFDRTASMTGCNKGLFTQPRSSANEKWPATENTSTNGGKNNNM